MLEYLPTFITFFGSISGIIIAFLVLLFNSSKNWLDTSKSDVIGEIKSCFECKILNDLKTFKGVDIESWDDLKLKADNKKFNLSDSKSLLKHLKETKTTTKEQKNHLDKYHISDLKSSIDVYNSALSFYNSFPKTVTWSIGVPLFITLCFISLLMFSNSFCFNRLYLDWFIFILSGCGVLFIFSMSVYTLIKLKRVNE